MNKNKAIKRNTLDKKSKANKTMHEVGIKTNFYVTKNSDIYTKVRVIGSSNREREVSVPATSLVYWYPFYFYYDWGFKGNANRWVLKIADNAPESARPYLHKNLYFTDCINLKTYETHVNSTISRMIFEVFKSDTYSDGTIETEDMGTTDTFEISQQGPVSGGFSIASDQTQGTDSMVISTKGGSPGTYFGWFYIRFSYGDIVASNRIDMYQY